MNPAADPPQLQPPQPPQPNRLSTSCDRHPDEHFSGFCPSCLCERFSVLEPTSNNAPSSSSSSRKPPLASAAAIRALFKPSSTAAAAAGPSSFFPELRRTKSFSASKNEGFSGVFEPQRRSCDVRARSTLWTLFSQDDKTQPPPPSQLENDAVVEPPRVSISSSSVRAGLVEEIERERGNGIEESQSGDTVIYNYNRFLEENNNNSRNLTARNSNANPIEEIIEEDEDYEDDDDGIVIVPDREEEVAPVVEEEELVKTMKDHIDLDSSAQNNKKLVGSFWSAASVFSKKLQKWRQKQKMKKQRNGCNRPGSGLGTLPVEKPIGRQYRETQSEIADYGFGRRSCDTDPRFSLDAGRMSFDDPRYSFDEPRASWDGYMIGGRTFPRMPTMLSVVEDAPVSVVSRPDAQIPVEEPPRASMSSINEDEGGVVPGGSSQTRDYYSDSSSRRRKSLDRSNPIRKTAAAVVAEIDELKSVSNNNAKVTPATVDYFQGPKLVVPDRDFKDSNSLRDDCSESFNMGFRDHHASVAGNGVERKEVKKSRRWGKSWNIWGLIHRGSVNKDEDDDKYSRANGVQRSFSESWPELRRELNGDARGGGLNPKFFRSNSSVSWRNSQNFGVVGGSFGSARKSNAETDGNVRNKRNEFVLERNRSARYSPNNIENGKLRLYLTPPLRGGGSGRRGPGWGKSKATHAQSIARSVLRLY